MPEPIMITRKGGPTLRAENGVVWLEVEAATEEPENQTLALLDASDLHWLVVSGGPAMLALLGGPLARVEE